MIAGLASMVINPQFLPSPIAPMFLLRDKDIPVCLYHDWPRFTQSHLLYFIEHSRGLRKRQIQWQKERHLLNINSNINSIKDMPKYFSWKAFTTRIFLSALPKSIFQFNFCLKYKLFQNTVLTASLGKPSVPCLIIFTVITRILNKNLTCE